MTATSKRRIGWAIGIGAVLIALALSLLIYAEKFGEHAEKYGALPWWGYIGCAISAHEGFAAGLIS
jgi:hypothetical protein